VVWVCVLLKVHPSVSTLAKPKLHLCLWHKLHCVGAQLHFCESKNCESKNLREQKLHSRSAASLTVTATNQSTHLTKLPPSNLTRLRSKHIESIPPAVGCSISRSIPPRADMLHIENPDRDLYRRAEGASPRAPKALIRLSSLFKLLKKPYLICASLRAQNGN